MTPNCPKSYQIKCGIQKKLPGIAPDLLFSGISPFPPVTLVYICVMEFPSNAGGVRVYMHTCQRASELACECYTHACAACVCVWFTMY